MYVRALIYAVAEEDSLGEVTETLKWGEPSYACPTGSSVRIDWKSKHPDQYAVYFNCNTKLIETFKELYHDIFVFDGNRAIVITLDEKLPEGPLKHCLSMSLRYKKIRHLPLLGA